MFKRIVTGILTFVLAAGLLCGCSFITHDTERDMRQKVAYVKSYTITNSIKNENGETVLADPYVTPEKTIYKRDLIDYVNNNASNLSQTFGSDVEGLYRYAVDMLVNVELVTNEVDALIACGKVEWGRKEQNTIKKNIYGVIDNTLTSLKNTILAERDEEQITPDDENTSVDAETTYPVKPEVTDDDDAGDNENVWEEEIWEPSKSRYPGYNGDSEQRSLEREAMRRFISLIESRVKDDFRITKEQREKFDAEIKAINKRIDTMGIEEIYPVIGTYPVSDESEFGHLMYFVTGESLERSQKITALQSYLTDGIKVSAGEVADRFTSQLNEQRSLYTSDIAAYNTDMSSSSTTTVLYHPNDNYFYVKHVLLPFSDEQTEALKAYKASTEVTSLQEKEQEKLINEYRARLADAIVCYPHENGEDDKSRPMSVEQVMSHIRSVMLPLQSNVASADVAFDDLVYLYNTDPGMFGNNKGYVVKYRNDAGEQETYMQEFADAARYMRENIEVGQVYYEPVITDYGVHIMYLASVVRPGAVGLYDYITPGKLETYYDILEKPIRTARESAAYKTWEDNVLTYNYNTQTELYEKAFSDLWGA